MFGFIIGVTLETLNNKFLNQCFSPSILSIWFTIVTEVLTSTPGGNKSFPKSEASHRMYSLFSIPSPWSANFRYNSGHLGVMALVCHHDEDSEAMSWFNYPFTLY